MKIAIIGGGAAGLVAAISAARLGGQVTLYEQNDKLGRKILATGNGRCNFSNMTLEYPDQINIRDYYHGSNPEFAYAAISQFSLRDTIRFFHDLGIYSKNQNGYLYPYSDQAAAVSAALSHEVNRLHVDVRYKAKVNAIHKKGDHFNVESVSEKGKNIECYDRVILTTGAKANPKSGSDGNGYKLCELLKIKIKKPLPCLTYLCSDASWLKQCAGVRFDDVKVSVGVFENKENVIKCCEKGNIQFTDKGISGIVVFQLSEFVARSLEKQKKVFANIDFMPEMDEKQLFDFLVDRMKHSEDKDIYESFVGLFPAKLIPVILRQSELSSSKDASKLSLKDMNRLTMSIKSLYVPIVGVGDFEHAQTCSGGVYTDQLCDTMEVINIPGLYLAGEILDIDGICGGYNLQFAWSTGWIAGANAVKK